MANPSISIVICTYNRRKYIRSALDSLVAQDLPPEAYEVIIVDNASSDDTAELCRTYIAEHPVHRIRYFLEERRGLSFARNLGIEKSESGIITFMDDDAEAVPEFLAAILQFLDSHPETAGVGGKIIPKYPDTGEPAWMSRYLDGFVARHDHGEVARIYSGAMKYPVGCNMTYRKAVLEKAGGFNTKLLFRSDDKYISQQVRQISTNIWYLPEAAVYHNIDGARVSREGFRKLFLKTGHEEKLRIRSAKGMLMVPAKGIEFLLKWVASLGIWILFTVKGEEQKGRFVMLSQWYTLNGFLRAEVSYR